jgi:hypothetical protein
MMSYLLSIAVIFHPPIFITTSVCAVRAAIRDGALPALLLGKRHVILREDADAWLNKLRAAA